MKKKISDSKYLFRLVRKDDINESEIDLKDITFLRTMSVNVRIIVNDSAIFSVQMECNCNDRV